MSSIYRRGSIWWAKSREAGQVVRWRLKTTDRAEAKRRLKACDSQARAEPVPAKAKGPTWDEALRRC
jgi:hypothetical protein